jgi:N6-adenosine-specific RNA methylase IME4
MLPDNERRPVAGAPHVEIVGGCTDNNNVAEAASTINTPIAPEERVAEPGGGPAPIKLDDSIRGLIPPLHADERAQLEANLLKDGCLDPLIVDVKSGVLLDGHNRYDICTQRGITYTVKRIHCADRVATELWVLEHQVGRRNLRDDQRAIIAAKICERRSGEARSTRASAAGKASAAKRKGNSETTSVSKLKRKAARTRTTVATEYNLSERKVGDALKIVHDDPAAADKILAGTTTIAEVRREVNLAQRTTEDQARHEALTTTLAGKVPSVVVAEPRWRTPSLGSTKSASGTLDTESICALRPTTTDDAVLFLWTHPSVLPDALRVMSEWGFAYRDHAVWDMTIASDGHWFRGQHELVLVGTKGNFSPPNAHKPLASVIRPRIPGGPRPKVFFRRVQEWWPDAVRLDLFGYGKRKGWLVHRGQA